MNAPPRYLVARWQSSLRDLFAEQDCDDVLEWLTANHDRRRVVLVGSGFSRNARNPKGTPIPLWEHIANALAADLGVAENTFDALTLADLHRRNLGESAFQSRLLGLLDNSSIEPGIAHSALWRSQPEAVITTNFLDTLLERNAAAQAVIEDPDLARPTAPGMSQVIYFHGHRTNFESWVAGRSDYDDLPHKRPMLFARARQLFAQFPLLVVGYSLTDPDFHLVYRQMVRAMKRRHPTGLAVLLPRRGEDSAQAQRASRKYWEDLGLRLVCFRERQADAWPEAFERFFSLTRRIESREDVECSYRTCSEAGGVGSGDLFSTNFEVMASAFNDSTLQRVWTRSSGASASFWSSVLHKAIPETTREAALEESRRFNLHKFRRTPADGATSLRSDEPRSLRRDVWFGGIGSSPEVEEIWKLLQEERGREFVWHLEVLLQLDANRATIANWLRVAVNRTDILDEPLTQGRTVLLALLLLGGWSQADVARVKALSGPRFPSLSKILGDAVGSDDDESSLVRTLKSARRAVEAGDVAGATSAYSQAIAAAELTQGLDGPLLMYFASRGFADAVADGFSSETRAIWMSAIDRMQLAKEHPVVQQWVARVERYKAAIRKAQVTALQDDLLRSNYEASSFYTSNGAWHLNVMLEDAKRLGAPLSLEAELTGALLSAFDDQYEAFVERVRLDLDKPGTWLARRLETGDLFRSRKGGLVPDLQQASYVDRQPIVDRINHELFGDGAKKSILHRKGILNVLESSAEIVAWADIDAAIALVADVEKDPNGRSASAWAALAHISSWSHVKEHLLAATGSEPRLLDLRRSALEFPWEHWTTCDPFVAQGGLRFLETLGEGCGAFERSFVGRAYAQALAGAPDDNEVVAACERFALNPEEHRGDTVDEEELALLATMTAISVTFAERNEGRTRWLFEWLQRDDLEVRRIFAQSRLPSALKTEALASYRRRPALGPNGRNEIGDIVLSTVAAEDQRVPWAALRSNLQTSWRGLQELAPLLIVARWNANDWADLRRILYVGGHRGKTGSWLVSRLNLAIDTLAREDVWPILFDDSASGLGFLRHAISTGCAGDGILANQSTYGLVSLAMRVRSDSDANSVMMALAEAADDVRPGVVHGAAFGANYLASVRANLHPQILAAAQDVQRRLAGDPLAIVRRQAEFGVAKGKAARE